MSPEDATHVDPPAPGKTPEDCERNAALLAGYDYTAYVEGLTGYTGQDLQRIGHIEWQDAVRTRVGPRGNYKAGMARRDDGTLILAACRDNHDPDLVKRLFSIFVYASTDNGLTWNEIGKTPLVGKEQSLTAFPDGSLVMTAQNGRCDPAVDRNQQPVYRSEDGGVTWEAFSITGTDYARSLVLEEDGRLMMVRALKADWKCEGFGSPNLEVARASDGGRTWTSEEGVVDWDWPAFGEVSTIRLRSGKLLASLRRQIPGTLGEGFEDTVITQSEDNGKTWKRPWPLLRCAEVQAYLTELDDGRLLTTYSTYHMPWGVFAVVSEDGGRTWDLDHPVQLALSAQYLVGWATTIQLPDSSLVTSYAATTYLKQEPDTSTCEVVRWRLPR